MIKKISFDESYLENFVYNGVESETAEDFNIKEVIKNYSQIGKSWMIIEDEKLIGVGGLFSLWNGLGQAWVFLNKEIINNKKFVFKEIKDCIDAGRKDYNQIQVLCMQNSVEANNLIKHLGFKKKDMYQRYTIQGDK